MEAAACGVASVLSDIRGCREIGTHEREVLLVPPGDVAALAAAIERLLLDASVRVRLASAARERAVSRFDQRTVARISLQAYATVARRKGLDWEMEEG
jgi:glycosyltransferase involved in cell wall biosynthesis